MSPKRSYHWVSMPHQRFSGNISRCIEELRVQFPVVHRDLFTPHPVPNPNKTVHQSKINAHLRSRYPSGEKLPKRHWSNGQDLRLPSDGSGFNSPVAQTFSSVTSCAFTAVMGIIISHAFTAIFGLISRAFTAIFGLISRAFTAVMGIISHAFTAVVGIVISHAFTAIFGIIISRLSSCSLGLNV